MDSVHICMFLHLTILQNIIANRLRYIFIIIVYIISFNARKTLLFHSCVPQDALNKAVLKDMRSNPEKVQEPVLAVERVYKQNMYGFTGDTKSLFLKITVALPRLIAPCKRLLEKEVVYSELDHMYSAFESNIDFDIRYVT